MFVSCNGSEKREGTVGNLFLIFFIFVKKCVFYVNWELEEWKSFRVGSFWVITCYRHENVKHNRIQ